LFAGAFSHKVSGFLRSGRNLAGKKQFTAIFIPRLFWQAAKKGFSGRKTLALRQERK